LLSLLVLPSSGLNASAQEDNNAGSTGSGNQLGFQTIATIVGLSGIVSGVSAVINLLLENYRSKEERKLKDVLNKHLFYKDIIYILERMLSSARFQKATEDTSEVSMVFESIHKIMGENYLLVEEEIKDEWHKVSGNWRESFEFGAEAKQRQEFALQVIKLRDLLVKKYNESTGKLAKTGVKSRIITEEKWSIEKLNYLREYMIEDAMKKHKK
jgi:hypothetical protein